LLQNIEEKRRKFGKKMDDINSLELTKYTKFAGCGAKLGPGTLDKALCGLKQPDYPNLIADFKTSEDAGIY